MLRSHGHCKNLAMGNKVLSTSGCQSMTLIPCLSSVHASLFVHGSVYDNVISWPINDTLPISKDTGQRFKRHEEGSVVYGRSSQLERATLMVQGALNTSTDPLKHTPSCSLSLSNKDHSSLFLSHHKIQSHMKSYVELARSCETISKYWLTKQRVKL